MRFEKALVFDIWADYAHFKKYFTVMSPLTFAIPPRTVIAGILGAIAGKDKLINPEIFNKDNSLIALIINKPIKKVKIASNNIKATSMNKISRFDSHKPTNIEYVKDPGYKIIFSHTDQVLYEDIKNKLLNHTSIYSIVLGISSCLANYSFQGESDIQELKSKDLTSIRSIIPSEWADKIDFDNGEEFQKCTLPNAMLNSREVTEYREFVYEVTGKSIKVECFQDNPAYSVMINNDLLSFIPM